MYCDTQSFMSQTIFIYISIHTYIIRISLLSFGTCIDFLSLRVIIGHVHTCVERVQTLLRRRHSASGPRKPSPAGDKRRRQVSQPPMWLACNAPNLPRNISYSLLLLREGCQWSLRQPWIQTRPRGRLLVQCVQGLRQGDSVGGHAVAWGEFQEAEPQVWINQILFIGFFFPWMNDKRIM